MKPGVPFGGSLCWIIPWRIIFVVVVDKAVCPVHSVIIYLQKGWRMEAASIKKKKRRKREQKTKEKKDEKDVVVSTDIHFGTTYKVLVTQLVFTNQLAGVGLARP